MQGAFAFCITESCSPSTRSSSCPTPRSAGMQPGPHPQGNCPPRILQKLMRRSSLQVVPYEPVQCKSCGGILNPYAQVDFAGRVWLCPLCHMRNAMPSQYHGISEQVGPQLGLTMEAGSVVCLHTSSLHPAEHNHEPHKHQPCPKCMSYDKILTCSACESGPCELHRQSISAARLETCCTARPQRASTVRGSLPNI